MEDAGCRIGCRATFKRLSHLGRIETAAVGCLPNLLSCLSADALFEKIIHGRL
jgi:hypothetical protein